MRACCYFSGMRCLSGLALLFVLSLLSAAAANIKGSYVGDWSGASGASGTFKLSITPGGENPKCEASFSYAGEEIKTNVTLCKTDGAKIEAQYDFDLGGNRLQSTIHGELNGDALAGKYRTKALADGSDVDAGDWKAAPAQ
jgi:hypothetical protein